SPQHPWGSSQRCTPFSVRLAAATRPDHRLSIYWLLAYSPFDNLSRGEGRRSHTKVEIKPSTFPHTQSKEARLCASVSSATPTAAPVPGSMPSTVRLRTPSRSG